MKLKNRALLNTCIANCHKSDTLTSRVIPSAVPAIAQRATAGETGIQRTNVSEARHAKMYIAIEPRLTHYQNRFNNAVKRVCIVACMLAVLSQEASNRLPNIIGTAAKQAEGNLARQANKFAPASSFRTPPPSSPVEPSQVSTPTDAGSSTPAEQLGARGSSGLPTPPPIEPTEQDKIRRFVNMTEEEFQQYLAEEEAKRIKAQEELGSVAQVGKLFQAPEFQAPETEREKRKRILREQVNKKIEAAFDAAKTEEEALERQRKEEEQAALDRQVQEFLLRGSAGKPAASETGNLAEQPAVETPAAEKAPVAEVTTTPVISGKTAEQPTTGKKKRKQANKPVAEVQEPSKTTTTSKTSKKKQAEEAKRLAEAQAAEKRLKAAQDAEAEQLARQAELARLEEVKKKELEERQARELRADLELAESIRQMQQRKAAAVEQAKIAQEAEIKRLADEAEEKRVAEENARAQAEQRAAEERQAQEDARRQAEQREQQRQEQERLRLEFEKQEREQRANEQAKEAEAQAARDAALQLSLVDARKKEEEAQELLRKQAEEQARTAQQEAAAAQAEEERRAAELEAQRAREEKERALKEELAALEEQITKEQRERAARERKLRKEAEEHQRDLFEKTKYTQQEPLIEEPLSFGERGGISFPDLPASKPYRMILPSGTSSKKSTVVAPQKEAEKLPEPVLEPKKLRPSKDEQAKVVVTPQSKEFEEALRIGLPKKPAASPIEDLEAMKREARVEPTEVLASAAAEPLKEVSTSTPLGSIAEETEEPVLTLVTEKPEEAVKEEVLLKEEPSVEPKAEPAREEVHKPLAAEPLEAKGVEAAGIREERSKGERAATPVEQKKELAASVMSIIQRNYVSGAAVVKGTIKEAVFEQIPAQDISALDDADLRAFEQLRSEYNALGEVGDVTQRLHKMKYVGSQLQALWTKLVGQPYIIQILKKQVG